MQRWYSTLEWVRAPPWNLVSRRSSYALTTGRVATRRELGSGEYLVTMGLQRSFGAQGRFGHATRLSSVGDIGRERAFYGRCRYRTSRSWLSKTMLQS